MKKLLFLFFFALTLIFPISVLAQSQSKQPESSQSGINLREIIPDYIGQLDQINNFHSEITINQDASISVKETLQYQTNLKKHGIYRYIPYRYQRNQLSYTCKIKNIAIIDDTQKPVSFTRSNDGKFITLKIGDPEVVFTGEKAYIITYTIENALLKFDNYDELYWDITGDGWNIPVLNSQAVINSPYADITDIACFSGITGSNDQLCAGSKESDTALFTYSRTISYGNNFTVSVALNPNNQIIFPTKLQKFIKVLEDNWLTSIAIIPAVIFFLIWNAKGRDMIFVNPNIYNTDPKAAQFKKPFFYQYRHAFHYEPIKDLTPGEAGLLIDEKVDNQDVIAEIIDLARAKYLKIESIAKKGIFGKQDYKFIKLKQNADSLSPQQKYLFDRIFSLGRQDVLMSELKGTFYIHVEKTKNLIADNLKQRQIFTDNPRNTRIGAIILAVFLNTLISIFTIILSVSYYSFLPISLSLLSGIISIFFAYNMPAKTAVGTNYYLQVRGLKDMINAGKWRQDIAEKNLFIEEILPFAIALGVVKKLASDMEELNLKAPDYLDAGMAGLSHFNTANFVNSFTQAANSNLSYNPSSNSYSGGSGFSGGSSGGGGGGGGGGSW